MKPEQIIEKHFDEMFKKILNLNKNNIYDLTREYNHV